MEFLNLLNELRDAYSDDCIVRKNGTLLLHPGQIPNCRHMLFQPLPQEMIEEQLIAKYKNVFPAEYISFLQYANGANLFTVRVKMENFSLAQCMFVLYGLPLNPPYSRPDGEEPYDVRIEDLARHKNIPQSWMKCGRYIQSADFNAPIDIFINTADAKVYACEKNKQEILAQWNNLDECFCDIFASLRDVNEEYVYAVE